MPLERESPDARLHERAAAWNVRITGTVDTESSLLAYGQRDGLPVVVKIARAQGDEWRSGDVLSAFDGRGTVPLIAHGPGAVLLERLHPGHSLLQLTLDGRDHEATMVLCEVITAMAGARRTAGFPRADDWFASFLRHGDREASGLSAGIVARAASVYRALLATQASVRLLHGDLHHDNILFDGRRGWLSIDPKGVVGEVEFELGAFLRNPQDRPELFLDPAIVLRRVDRLSTTLQVDRRRVLGWAFAQSVLSVLWGIEDGDATSAVPPSARLAAVLAPMVDDDLT